MAAPTLVAASFGTAATGVSATSGSVSWQTSDVVVVIYGNEGLSATFLTPTTTGSGLSFTVAGSVTGSGSQCGAGLATAVATANSSGTVTASINAGPSGNNFVGVYVFRGSQGVGNNAISTTPSSTKTVSLTPTAADGAICWGVFDFFADATVAFTPTPTTHTSGSPGPSATPTSAQVAGHYTYYWGELDDQTSSGAVSYGVGGTGTGPFTIVALEVKTGAGGTDATVIPPARVDVLIH